MQKANMDLIVNEAKRADEYAKGCAHVTDTNLAGKAQESGRSLLVPHADSHASDAAFANAVNDSTEVGIVVPSILRANLAKAGFKVVDDAAKMSEYGFKSSKWLKRVAVFDKAGTLLAMGAAPDVAEATAAAALGWFREHPLEGSPVHPAIAPAPVVATVKPA